MTDDTVTLGRAFRDAMFEEMERDETIFIMGTDLTRRGGHFGQVVGLSERFGEERVRNTPISESAMVLAAVGAALNGMRPVVDLSFIDFSLSAMDEILNQVAKIRYMYDQPVPVVIRGSSGTAAYAAQHNNALEATFAHTPGLVVVEPSTPADTKGILKTALRGDDPVIFFMHKKLGGIRGPVGEGDATVELGRASTLRLGDDATLISFGLMAHHCLAAADQLQDAGIAVDVIDLRTVHPFDADAVLSSVRRTGRAIVVAEEAPTCGVAAEIATVIQEEAFDYLDAPVVRVTQPHSPVPHSPALIDAFVPTASEVAAAVKRSLADWPSEAVAS